MLTLDEIKLAYQEDASFEHLRDSKFVPGVGPHNDVMMVGEAPGKYEDQWGMPFVGPAGRILERELNRIDLSRDKVYLTNILKYRPYPPRDTNRSPNPQEIEASLPYLSEEVSIVNPRIIVLMGRIATNAFYPTRMFRGSRGSVLDRKGRKVLITYHPAAVIYDKTGTKIQALRSDYNVLRELIDNA